MSSLNKAALIGHLGRDPETRHLDSGTVVCNFSIATNEKYGDSESTSWHRIVAFGKLAEICQKYLTKGKAVYIEGRIQYREWEDREGNKRTTTEIVAREMVMLGGGDPRPQQPTASKDIEDDDIPF